MHFFNDVFPENKEVPSRDYFTSLEVVSVRASKNFDTLQIHIRSDEILNGDRLAELKETVRRRVFPGKNIKIEILKAGNETSAVAPGESAGRKGSAGVTKSVFGTGESEKYANSAKSENHGIPGPNAAGSPASSQASASSAASASAERSSGTPSTSSKDKSKPLPGQNGFKRSKNEWTPSVNKKSENPDLVYGYDFKARQLSVSELDENTGEAVISGRVFATEAVKTRTGKWVLKFNLTDLTDSIGCRLIVDENAYNELEPEIKDGRSFALHGSVMPPDNFNPELSFGRIKGIKKAPDPLPPRKETYEGPQRVELSLHTKLSDMDGISDFSAYAKQMTAWGRDAVAVTDDCTVQCFPAAAKALSKTNVKFIMGLSGNLVDDTPDAVYRPAGQRLDGGFVVFDIETTGFSMEECRIIEIGAVKVIGGVITERYSQFIDPEVPIPPRIRELTSITDEDVHGQGSYEYHLPHFLDFVGNLPVVGHNAMFDVGFISHYAETLGIRFRPTVVDTLGLSHMLLKHLYRNRLDNVAKEVGVDLSSHHRAVYDAEATAGIFLKFCEMLKNRGIEDLDKLYAADEMDAPTIHKIHPYNFSLLVKNDLGRTNLYRLVSAAHIDYFYNVARMPRSVVNSMREGLLVGSGTEEGELYDLVMRGADEETLLNTASFYDYLELMPPSNILYLTGDESCAADSRADLVRFNRVILDLGKKLDKPVIASGNVHFAEPSDALFRKVLRYFVAANKGRGDSFDVMRYEAPLYMRTTDEMLYEFREFSESDRMKVVINDTRLLADMCEKLSPVRPDKCPPVIENSDNELREICYKKVHELYGETIPELVETRLEKELKSIISNGYSVMYIIAQRLVWDSNDHGFLVGSRGSVGSSLVATLAGISEVNPLPPHYRCEKCHYSDFESDTVREYADKAGCDLPDRICPVCGTPLIKDGFDIPFETFLGFKGDKEPDIDLNFAGEYQSKAHAYTEVIFAGGETYKAGTIGTVQDKTAYGYVLRYNEDHAIENMRRAEVERIALGMTEIRRTTGQHPGGIIVLPKGEEINTFTPIQHPANDMSSPVTTHFDYHSIDHNLLKLDILGKDDPSMVRMLEELTGINCLTVPVGPPEVLELFKSTETLGITPEEIGGTKLGTMGIPEFGTDFAIQMLLDAQPRYVSDLVRIAGLAHGTDVWVGNAKKLIEEGKCTIQTAICTRDDIMIYLISMGLDKAVSFKIMELVRKGKFPKDEKHEAYCTMMRDAGVPDWYIWSCDTIKYMFPKAHAAAYVVMSLRIGWYKVHYPQAYYAAYFTIKGDGYDYESMCVNLPTLRKNLGELKEQLAANRNPTANDKNKLRDMRIAEEMLARGFEFAPIDIRRASAKRFTLLPDGRIMPSLTSLAGLGENAARSLEADAVNGDYLSIDEFIARTKVTKTNADLMKRLGLLKNLPESNQLSLFDLPGVSI